MLKYFVGIILLSSTGCFAQKYLSTQGQVSFFSHAAIEDIKADNTKATAILDMTTNAIAFVIPVAEFQFAKALMQEHFNEKYMETEKFPKATFQGKIDGFQSDKSGPQEATAIGKLTIHGVTNEVKIPGTIHRQENKISMKSKFMVKLADYKVTIPQIMWQKIAEQVEVSVEFTLVPQ